MVGRGGPGSPSHDRLPGLGAQRNRERERQRKTDEEGRAETAAEAVEQEGRRGTIGRQVSEDKGEGGRQRERERES